MEQIQSKLEVLKKAPDFLEELVGEVPDDRLKKRRIPGKWSIHEHACHLPDAQQMILERFQTFKEVPSPKFTPFLPGTDDTPDDHLQNMDLQKALQDFSTGRHKLVALLETFTEEDWKNEGYHPEYEQYNPRLFLRHVMMHDHFHMYRIEELWLTTDEYLDY